MRPDQLDLLKALRDRLIDEVSREADPKNWPATDSAQGRGDRYWFQKNCLATLDLIDDLNKLVRSAGNDPLDLPGGVDEDEIARAEKTARDVLARIAASSSGDEEDDEDKDE